MTTTITNIAKYKGDLSKLISEGDLLQMAMENDCFPEQIKKLCKGAGKEYTDLIKHLPSFSSNYQSWYSESLALIKQLLHDRVADFTRLYEKPKTKRKDITHENYTIEDYLFDQTAQDWSGQTVVGPSAAIPRFRQQLNILKSVEKRFESSLFDIKQLVQADLFDTELESAKELNKNGFARGAGAIAGVVLEKHLSQISDNHGVTISKKAPSISDFNEKLKQAGIYETPIWRKIQHLSDLRNLCDHKKKKDPTEADVNELIGGVETITKTLF
ncbi:MAG: hypothetical protein JW873_03240 [Candidatus Saganbacteria bacterium]|nr:hypothetical protein [Candidatus Saganbacteria bacterium]